MNREHNFGGSAMDRYVFEYEPDGEGYDGVSAEAYDAVAASLAGESTPPQPVETAPVAPVPAPWQPDPAEWAGMRQAVHALDELKAEEAEQLRQAEAEELRYALDPIENEQFGDTVAAYIQEAIREGIQQQLGPLFQGPAGQAPQAGQQQPSAEAVAAAGAAEGMLDEVFQRATSGIDDLDRDAVLERADGLVDEVRADMQLPADQFHPAVAEEAIRRAAGRMADEQKALEPTDDYDEALRRIRARDQQKETVIVSGRKANDPAWLAERMRQYGG